MTVTNILLYVALIGYVVSKKLQGQPIKEPRSLLGLPIILVALGLGELVAGAAMKPVEVAVISAGAVLSLVLGLMRGRTDSLSDRDGVRLVRWGRASLALFGVNIAVKLVLDVVGVAAGGSASAFGKSLIFTFGLTLLGEALVLLVRSGGNVATARGARRHDSVYRPRPSGKDPEGDLSSRPSPSPSLVAAIGQHHSDHRERHARKHDRRRS